MKSVKGFYRSWQVCRETKATPRQLQWWDERRVIAPLVDGKTRLYTAEQVEQVRRLVNLRKAGASLQQIRRLKLLDVPCTRVMGLHGRPRVVEGVLVVP